MNAFVNAINAPAMTTTTNGMAAYTKTGSKVLDMFSTIGSSRNNVDGAVANFLSAFGDDKLLAMKCLFWARDARGGAGERSAFRNMIVELEKVDADVLIKNIHLIPVYGRWDDGFVLSGRARSAYFDLVGQALKSGDGLCAKWCHRKGAVAANLRSHLGLSPKAYRKLIVGLSNTVEQKMCAKQFGDINYSHVPSVAASRYQAAFARNDQARYEQYRQALKDGTAKINASVSMPHDIIKALKNGDSDVCQAQWDALPNYVGDTKVLPVSDVSGSMACTASGTTSCMDVSVALGVYLASKNTGPFKDVVLTFHSTPEMYQLSGNLATKVNRLYRAPWGGSTDIAKTFDLVLNTAIKHSVPQEDMPEVLVILSDMQFNQSDRNAETAVQMAHRKFEAAGYKAPLLVFWNLNAQYGNQPSTKNATGTILVSGFSPAIMKAVLSCDFDKINPYNMMLEVLNSERYASVVI